MKGTLERLPQPTTERQRAGARTWFGIGAVLLGLLSGSSVALAQAPAEAERALVAAPLPEPEAEVVVTVARRDPLTASTTHVSARELAAVPMRSAEDALRLVPGFTLVQHGSEGKGHQFFLRGFDAVHGADLELTVEGIPVNEWSNIHAQGYIDLGFIIPEVIEAVLVTKGPFSMDQGAFAMAGSAEYHLGVPLSELGVRTSYTIGTTHRHRGVVTYSPSSGDGQDFIALEALHDAGFGQNREIQRGAVLGRARLFDSPDAGALSLLGSGYLARFELPGSLRNEDVAAGRVGFYDAYDRRGGGRSERALLALSYERGEEDQGLRALAFAGYRQLGLLENFTGFLLDPVNGDRRAQTQVTRNVGADLSGNIRLLETLQLRLGGGGRIDVFEQSQDHVDQQELVLAPERDLDGYQSLVHAKAGLEWRLGRASRVLGGARFDLVRVAARDPLAGNVERSDTLVAVSPRLSAVTEVLEGWSLFAAYGRGFRPPEARAFSSFEPQATGISEDVYAGGAPSLTLSDSFELGTRVEAGQHIDVRAAGFATFIERESVFDHVSGINLELNGTRRLGAEVELHASPLGWLDLSADATLVDARFVESGNAVPLAPWLSGGVRAVVGRGGGWNGGLRLLSLLPRPLPHGARGSTLMLLDATLGYRWKHVALDLDLENLPNLQLREGEYHYASHWRPGEPPSQLPVLHYVAGPPFNARLTLTAVY